MSRNPSSDYTKFVHEFDKDGVTFYAVAQLVNGQYICPLDRRSQELTGCSSEFASAPAGIGGYKSRAQALRRARYLFGGK